MIAHCSLASRGIERLWEVSAPVLSDPPPLHHYDPGSWGPEAMDGVIAPRRWHLPDGPTVSGPHADGDRVRGR